MLILQLQIDKTLKLQTYLIDVNTVQVASSIELLP